MIYLYKNKDNQPAQGTVVELSGCATLDELYALMANVFDFPEYFGNNLDALFDCLCDLPEMPLPIVLSIDDAFAFLANEAEEEREELFCLLNDVADTWVAEQGEGFVEVWVRDFEGSSDFFEDLFIKTK